MTSDSCHLSVPLLKQGSSFNLIQWKTSQDCNFFQTHRANTVVPQAVKYTNFLKEWLPSPDINQSMRGENPFSKENWNAFFLARKHYHLGHLNYLSYCMLLKYFSIIPYLYIHLTFFKCLWHPTPGDWNLLLKGQRVNILSFASQDAKITEIM